MVPLISSVMQFLERTFGYDTAIKMKESFDFIDGVIFGALILLWLIGKFFMEVSRDDKLSEDIAIMWVEKDGVLGIVANPKNVVEAVEVFIGYLFLKIFRPKRLTSKKNTDNNGHNFDYYASDISLWFGRFHVPILPA